MAIKGKTAVAAACAATLAFGGMPALALAADAPTTVSSTTGSDGSQATGAIIDKASFYRDAEDSRARTTDGATLLSVNLNATVSPRSMSKELLYFAQFESGQNYDQGFSYGDGYHALGYYQLDNRYGLQSFMVACYNYDPSTFGMFAWLKNKNLNIANETIYDKEAGKLTEIGQRLEDSWHAAYAANPTLFSRLQDGWYYQDYIQPAISYLNGRGLKMDGRRDCIKGLVSGVCSLFGSGGMRYFVGGYFDGTDWPGAGLTGDMSDHVFATTLCNYIIDHVAEFYPNQPQYHQGWQNRYRNELKIVLDYLGKDGYPSDVNVNDWYVTSGAYDFVTSKGYMGGYGNGLFGPYDTVTRGQVVTVLWRMAGSPKASSTPFADVDYSQFYGAAVRWCRAVGVANGDGANSSASATFRPNDPVTREELATFFANYAARVDGKNTSSTCAKMDRIEGASSVSGWARQSMGWAVDQGLISGSVDDNGVRHLDPRGNAWRASLASMVKEYMS